MVNQQLVDYIKQQMQGGVGKDAIKKALLDAGWPATDVDDSMKAADPTAATAAAAQPAASSKIDTAAIMGGGMATNPTMSVSPSAQRTESKFFSEPGATVEQPSHGSRIALIVMGALIVILLATLGYIYFSLNGKVSNVSGLNAITASEGEALRAQVTQLNADKTALTAQITTLTEQNQGFTEEIAFITPASTPTTTEVSATIHGTVAGTTNAYYLTTAHGIKINIKNSKDARVDAGLKPLIGQVAAITGNHKAAALDLTITSINGTELANISTSTPAAATTTTP